MGVPDERPVAIQTDVLVVGAGPGGLAAAIEAARAGLEVLVVDENRKPGGQIYRQPPEEFHVEDEPDGSGSELIREARALPIRFIQNTTVWGELERGWIDLAGSTGTLRVRAEATVIAVGANDRPVPIPGWTLPGVVTAGGAQVLVKSQMVLPGRRILLAGAGPLQLVLAAQLASVGANVVGIAEAVPFSRHLRYAPGLVWGGRLLLEGLRYRSAIRRAGIRWMSPAILTGVKGDDRVQAAVVARADRAWRPIPGTERIIEVDCVCLGYGLVPSIEVARLLGCEVRYEPTGDAWVPVRDSRCETTVPNVFAVGDGAGVAGAKVAEEEGRVAGMVIADRRGGGQSEGRIGASMRRIRRLKRFASAINAVYTPGPGLFELTQDDTDVCRCEEVTLGTLRACLQAGARELSELKAWTRAGMGPCQGKMCGATVARLVSRSSDTPLRQVRPFSVRPPVRSIPLASLLQATTGEEAPGTEA